MGDTTDARTLIEKWQPFIKVGDVYDRYTSLPESHPNRYQFQVRALVDAEDIDSCHVVTRRWMERKGYWHYDVKWVYDMALNLESESFVLLEEHEYDDCFSD